MDGLFRRKAIEKTTSFAYCQIQKRVVYLYIAAAPVLHP